MSSASFRQIGKNSSLTSIVRSLAAEYQKFAAKSITTETTDFKSKHRTTQSLLKYNELALQAKKKPITTQFYSPLEPDFKNVVLMLGLQQNGRYATDGSGFGNRGKIAGAGYMPQIIKDDGIDEGFGAGSQYLFFDGFYTFVFVEDSPLLRANKTNTSLCFTFRLYLYPGSWTLCDPDDQTKPRYIFAKCDDFQQQYGYACAITSDGRIKFTWKQAGTATTIQTDSNVITLQHPGYDIQGFTGTGYNAEQLVQISQEQTHEGSLAVFNVAITVDISAGFDSDGFVSDGFQTGPGGGSSDGSMNIVIDSAFLTNSATPVITYYNQEVSGNGAHLDLFVGNEEDLPDDIDDPNAIQKTPNFHENYRLRIGAAYPFSGDQQGWYKFLGGIQRFQIYRDRLLTAEDISFLFLNKLTIAPIPFGQVAYAGSTILLPTAVGCCGFSATGYSSTGYDTGL